MKQKKNFLSLIFLFFLWGVILTSFSYAIDIYFWNTTKESINFQGGLIASYDSSKQGVNFKNGFLKGFNFELEAGAKYQIRELNIPAENDALRITAFLNDEWEFFGDIVDLVRSGKIGEYFAIGVKIREENEMSISHLFNEEDAKNFLMEK